MTDRDEVKLHWLRQNERRHIRNLPRWAKVRIEKKAAKWLGKACKVSVPLFWGQEMSVVFPEFVSGRLGKFGFFEDDVTSMFIDCLEPGMTFYDVGSHYGYFSLLASSLVGPKGHVFAFEPTAATYEVLTENAARRDNITCCKVAAYRTTGPLAFIEQGVGRSSLNFVIGEGYEPDPADHMARETTVAAVRLDNFAYQHGEPDFLKIDTEGAEIPVLEGLIDTIHRYHPTIVLEMGDHVCSSTGNGLSRQNVDFLLDHGYEVFEYRNRVRHRHVPRDRYSYTNLLFRHPTRMTRPRIAK